MICGVLRAPEPAAAFNVPPPPPPPPRRLQFYTHRLSTAGKHSAASPVDVPIATSTRLRTHSSSDFVARVEQPAAAASRTVYAVAGHRRTASSAYAVVHEKLDNDRGDDTSDDDYVPLAFFVQRWRNTAATYRV